MEGQIVTDHMAPLVAITEGWGIVMRDQFSGNQMIPCVPEPSEP